LAPADPPQAAYVDALLADLDVELALRPQARALDTLFIGGGTPSLLAGRELARLLAGVRARLALTADAELTLEANPGAADAGAFADSLGAGITRLSLGAQSLSDSKLKAIGRLHDAAGVRQAVAAARSAGCDNLNLDLMFGLPGQSLAQARADLIAALRLAPEHLSYYQLTLEPGTGFARAPPVLPEDDLLAEMADQGECLLADAGFCHYEISAYARSGRVCRHNLNYWRFGDYLGIGAGAHGKVTAIEQARVVRRVKWSQPARYLAAAQRLSSNPDPFVAESVVLRDQDLVLEFALNGLRLTDGVPLALFEARTGLARDALLPAMVRARAQGLLVADDSHLRASTQGRNFLNQLLEYFVVDPGESAQGRIHSPRDPEISS
jgi:oxygen-independent coproporphyrinogen-3 oxidase